MQGSYKTNNIKRDVSLSKAAFLLSVFAGILLLAFLIAIGTVDNTDIKQSRIEKGYVRVENYNCQEVEDTNTPIGVREEYTFTLDKTIANDTNLAFYTVHQYVEVWLDGENVFRLYPSQEQQLCKTVGSNWVMLPIYREDAGKEIRVEIIPVYESFRDRKVEIYIGSELAIYKDRLSKDLPQLLLGAMAVFVGFIFICVAGYNILRKQRGWSIAALGMFSVMMGVWRLTDTRFTPFIFPEKPVLMFYISVIMMMLGMVPFIKCIEEYFNGKGRRILNIYCICVSIVCVIQLLLQVFRIFDLRDILFITHIEIAVGVVIAVGAGVYERIKYPGKPKMPMGNELMYLCVAGVMADVAAYYMKGNSSGLLFSLLAFLLYIVFMGFITMFNYSEQEVRLAEQGRLLAEQNRELAEKERKLTERRIAAMMSQIRTHFIFNVLTTISGYCKIDPKKADNALIRFSRYLRKNIKIIEEEGLIDFSVELEQVEDYIVLEQLRFQDRIQFEKDIETSSFQIPPLTIQPIVENAIKHGLIESGKSGIIRLHTAKRNGCIEITVIDNGAGFVSEKCEKEDSVGIRNVRYRLENMVGGSLTIESEPGQGTKATIRIPDKES